MKITTCGASGGEVTGSGYLVDTGTVRVLVDFGLFQGRGALDERNRVIDPIDPARLDAVVLTHAHVDHCGRLPLLAKAGYKGPVFATAATLDFTDVLLADSARLAEADTERENRRRLRRGKETVEPLYTSADAAVVRTLGRAVEYNKPVEVAPGVTARYVDAGHILGSASVELTVRAGGAAKTIVFSGDIGRWDTPILNDPQTFSHADLVFMESTYGDREHRPLDESVAQFGSIVHDSIWAKEKVLVPAFALGRTQQLLYHLAAFIRKGALPEFPIYLDSPLAIGITDIYLKHQRLADTEARRLLDDGTLRTNLRNLHPVATAPESMALNTRHEPCIIIAGSGMCDGGRIVHHLRHNIWRRGVSVVLVGYQAPGSLGRALNDGAAEVQIFGEPVVVRANVHSLSGFSAHAGQSELLRWITPLAQGKPRVVLTHGEDSARNVLAIELARRLGLSATLPKIGDTITL